MSAVKGEREKDRRERRSPLETGREVRFVDKLLVTAYPQSPANWQRATCNEQLATDCQLQRATAQFKNFFFAFLFRLNLS